MNLKLFMEKMQDIVQSCAFDIQKALDEVPEEHRIIRHYSAYKELLHIVKLLKSLEKDLEEDLGSMDAKEP